MTGSEAQVAKLAVALWGRCVLTLNDPNFEPFIDGITKAGINLVPLESQAHSHFLSLDYSDRAFKRYGEKTPVARRMLITFEPAAVNPAQHKLRVRNRFGKVCVLSPLQIRSHRDQVLSLGPFANPGAILKSKPPAWSHRKDSIAVLNENKFSLVKRNNYRLRRIAIEELNSNGYEVDLGGKNWDKGFFWLQYQQLKTLAANILAGAHLSLSTAQLTQIKASSLLRLFGRVEDGIAFLGDHKIALIVENDPSYLSEKLLHAIQAGAVPVYVGPSLQFFDIPPEVALACAASPEAIVETIKAVDEALLMKTHLAGQDWLKSPGVLEKWSLRNAMDQMARETISFIRES